MNSNYEDDDQIVNDIRKNATHKTKRANEAIFKKIDWMKVEVEENLAKSNLVANAYYPFIRGKGKLMPVWDLSSYKFLMNKNIPYTVNPRLWVQGNLNLHAGLFRVSENIYQVRGFDLGNMTLVRGEKGWIIIDCLGSKETVEAALDFVNQYFGQIPVSTIIITHSHIEHYGGILGVLNKFAREDIKIYAPNHFNQSVLEENVYAGIAMYRRGIYKFGVELPRDEKGQIDIGNGKYQSAGTVTFSENVEEIEKDYSALEVDGISMEFLLALDTKATSELFVYIPCEESLYIAEDYNATLHNRVTLRGAKVRDAVTWAKNLQSVIDLWGDSIISIFGVHNWPRFGKKPCIDYLEKQRDIYQYINDQTLRLMNKGYAIDEVGRLLKVPVSLTEEWYHGEFYKTVIHNAKDVYQRYLGWYNGNPVELNKLIPEESAKKYVEYMGGEECVLEKAKKSYLDGEYQWVAEVIKMVIYANPGNRSAKLLCADALEQLGYLSESGTWRNEYLMGAMELRYGILPTKGDFISYDMLSNLPLKDVLYLFSIRLDGVRAGDLDYKMNFIIPDRNEEASAEVKRGIFRYLSALRNDEAVVSITMPKKILYDLATTNKKIDNTKIIVQGDRSKWNLFLSMQDSINQDFNIMTPVGI